MFSQRHFPKDDFPSDNFSEEETSLMCNVRLGLLRRRRLQWGEAAADMNRLGGRALRLGQTWKLSLGKLYICEVATWEIGHL